MEYNLDLGIFAISFIVFIWLKTNAFIDFFGPFLRIFNILYTRDYLADTLRDTLTYPLWLYVKKPFFLTKLLSCPLCLCFWSSVLVSHNITSWFCNSFFALIGFSVLDFLYKHAR